MINLAQMYELGLGVPKSRRQANAWKQKATESGNQSGSGGILRASVVTGRLRPRAPARAIKPHGPLCARGFAGHGPAPQTDATAARADGHSPPLHRPGRYAAQQSARLVPEANGSPAEDKRTPRANRIGRRASRLSRTKGLWPLTWSRWAEAVRPNSPHTAASSEPSRPEPDSTSTHRSTGSRRLRYRTTR